MNDKVTFKFEEQYQAFNNKQHAWHSVLKLIDTKNRENGNGFNNRMIAAMKNSNLNRYIDVLPYDESRVKLQNLANDYVNASLIQVNDAERNYILTQGPLAHTVPHFWLMIWQQNSRAIVMLNKLVENDIDKCYPYWPIMNKSLKFDDIGLEIELLSENEDKTGDFVIREFKLTNLKDANNRVILQFHYLRVPDFGVPKSPESFVNFLYICRKSGYLNSNKYGPSIIHCSAGIGRSGTFILVDSFLILLKKSIEENKPQPDVLELLINMRKYRIGLVQTHIQLRFAYEAIITAKNSEFFKQPDEIETLEEQKLKIDEKPIEQINNNETELRKRKREEKKLNTINHIKRIKDKQKEIDSWNHRFKLIKYLGVTLLVTGVFMGSLYYKYRSINEFY